MQRVLHGQGLERLVQRLIGQFEFLPRSQSDDARHRQLLNRKVISRLNQLLLPRLQLHLCPQPIDRRRSACIHLVGCLVVYRLRSLDLRFRRFRPGLRRQLPAGS